MTPKQSLLRVVSLAVLAFLSAFACAGELDEHSDPETSSANLEFDAAEAASEPPLASRNLDAPGLGPGKSAEIDLIAGRLSNVPVSWFHRGTYQFSGVHPVSFRTSGCTGTADTGLIVTWSEGGKSHTAFDNDGNGKCSLVDTGLHTATINYTLYAFSMVRATSRANLEYSLNNGSTWKPITSGEFGGTLVRVGALSAGDFLQVQTPSDGIGDDGTRLLLFEPSGTGAIVQKAPRFNDANSSADADPKIAISDSSWGSRLNAVLIGKDSTSGSGIRSVETRVQLLRGPLDQFPPLAAMSCAGASCSGAAVVLPRGRYYASLFARTDLPLGSKAGGVHLATAMGDDTQNGCQPYARGQSNGLVFKAVLTKNGVPLMERLVPRGLLGEDPAFGSHSRIVFEIDADGSSSWSLGVTNKAPDVTIRPSWELTRNPDVSTLKIASYNLAYWAYENDETARKSLLKNAADLLGTRGDIDPVLKSVVERPDQAPWQWDADVIAFQEFFAGSALHVRARLEERTTRFWDHVNANTEIYDLSSWESLAEQVYYGPVFVSDRFYGKGGIRFHESQLDDKHSSYRCNSRWAGDAYDFACPLGSTSYKGGTFYNRAVPAKLRARRQHGSDTGTDRPVAFFNWHLFHEDTAFGVRNASASYLVEAAEYLMQQDPVGSQPAGACAFNKECSKDPKHPSNRIIIVGDSNAKNHHCAEFSWLLKPLRLAFGYAIDVSSATLDSEGRTMDLHYSGASLGNPNVGKWGPCKAPWARTLDGTSNECPYHYLNRNVWNAQDNQFSPLPWYSWWAATTQRIDGDSDIDDNGDADAFGGNRYDVIFLVGRGWADDDPILTYRVMSGRNEPSHSNGGFGGGVEMGYDVWTCAGRIPDSGQNYNPNFAIQPVGQQAIPGGHAVPPACGTGPGRPALRSDHIPIGARLRVWSR